MPSTAPGGHTFSRVPKAEIERSQFDRSHGLKTTFDAGVLVPVYVDEVLPGDTFHLNMMAFARLATPLKPLMDNMYLETFFFFVPYRLVWTNFQKFMGEQEDPGDSTSFTIPQMELGVGESWGSGTMGDFMGIPIVVAGAGGYTHNVLPMRAYNLIWNEWFRDQNMQPSLTVLKTDGPEGYVAGTSYLLQRRGKRHDYFTSCLPWPQKGTAVVLPLGTTAPVIPNATPAYPTWDVGLNVAGVSTQTEVYGQVQAGTNVAEWRDITGLLPGLGTPTQRTISWHTPALMADLSAASSASINSLRQAFQMQKYLERDARGGTRYTEKVKAHFGVTSPDARLQRPEYLGGGSSPIMVSPVAQTSSTDATTPQANLAGIGTGTINGHGFTKSFTEHGILLGLVCARADLTYYQGLERMWSRSTVYDFFWPSFAHIGEQAVLRKEIYLTGVTADDNTVFGYQERYAEYRYKPSRITGLFRPDAAGSLDVWHLAQVFGAAPILDETFIHEDPPIDRVIAVPTEPHYLLDAYLKLICARPMPVYGVPGFTDHF